jgi:hypothetical protein
VNISHEPARAQASKRPCAPNFPIYGFEQICRRVPRLWFVSQLAIVAGLDEVTVEQTRHQRIADDRLGGREAHPNLAPRWVLGGKDDRSRRNLGLKDRRHRLRFLPGSVQRPVELRRI